MCLIGELGKNLFDQRGETRKMMYLKRTIPITIILLLAMAVAACGGSTRFWRTNTNTPVPTATATTTSSALLKNATATGQEKMETILTKSETILTNANGKTLYYFTPDTATTPACTSACAQNWPPLLATGTGTPTSATSLSGKLTTQKTANGNQVEYNGHLLYTFASDTAPGDTKGAGLFGKWFVATPDLPFGTNSPVPRPPALLQTPTVTEPAKYETIPTHANAQTLYSFP